MQLAYARTIQRVSHHPISQLSEYRIARAVAYPHDSGSAAVGGAGTSARQYSLAHLSKQSVEVRRVAWQGSGPAVEQIMARVDARTRAVICSAITWDTGYRMDIETLGVRCAASGCLLIVVFSLGDPQADSVLVDKLAARNIIVAQRPQGICVLPHLFRANS